MFAALGVSINTLEFFAIIYCLLVWAVTFEGTAHSLRDSCVHVELDNTAAVSWLLKNRSSSPTAHCIVRLYSLAMSYFGITIGHACHLAGLLNTRADDLSRVDSPIDFSDIDAFLLSQAQRIDPQLEADLRKVGTTSKHLRVEANCRKLLLTCVVSPQLMPMPTLLGHLVSLGSAVTETSANSSDCIGPSPRPHSRS